MKRLYIMDVTFLSNPEMYQQVIEKIDEERKRKIEHYSKVEDRLLGMGAGILLQYIVKTWQDTDGITDVNGSIQGIPIRSLYDQNGLDMKFGQDDNRNGWQILFVTCEPDKMEEPRPITYLYGAEGKPYLKEYPECHISISHSGEYVICAVSNEEVGADIQQMREVSEERILRRFYTSQEREWLATIPKENRQDEEEDRRNRFYRLWAAKESYMKLTGKGMVQGIDSFTADLENGRILDEEEDRIIRLTEIFILEKYAVCICEYAWE